jgi:hypothetical protein
MEFIILSSLITIVTGVLGYSYITKKTPMIKVEVAEKDRLVDIRIRMRKMGGIAVDDLTNISKVNGIYFK